MSNLQCLFYICWVAVPPYSPPPGGTFSNLACTPCCGERKRERKHFARANSPSCSLLYLPLLVTKVPAFFWFFIFALFGGGKRERVVQTPPFPGAGQSHQKVDRFLFLFKISVCKLWHILVSAAETASSAWNSRHLGRIANRLVNMNPSIWILCQYSCLSEKGSEVDQQRRRLWSVFGCDPLAYLKRSAHVWWGGSAPCSLPKSISFTLTTAC